MYCSRIITTSHHVLLNLSPSPSLHTNSTGRAAGSAHLPASPTEPGSTAQQLNTSRLLLCNCISCCISRGPLHLLLPEGHLPLPQAAPPAAKTENTSRCTSPQLRRR
mmetsp:Transcript_30975/g.68653  ORF Transcript_30975/g.68653 Transcript_30975/m.68653 type:complete len:107 (+) Transcript_30975:246-566(+)